jgi:hypothetical protein
MSTACRCTPPASSSTTTACASAPAPNCCARRPSCRAARGGRHPGHRRHDQRRRHAAIEALLDTELRLPVPEETGLPSALRGAPGAVRAWRAVQARHILFAVTPGVEVQALRKRAEACAHRGARRSGAFCRACAHLVQLPERRAGRRPGQPDPRRLRPRVRPRAVRASEVGVLPRLVHSRFGLHVVEVLAREPGRCRPSKRCVARWRRRCSSRPLHDRAAPVPASAGRARHDRGRGARPRRDPADAVGAARRQPGAAVARTPGAQRSPIHPAWRQARPLLTASQTTKATQIIADAISCKGRKSAARPRRTLATEYMPSGNTMLHRPGS